MLNLNRSLPPWKALPVVLVEMSAGDSVADSVEISVEKKISLAVIWVATKILVAKKKVVKKKTPFWQHPASETTKDAKERVDPGSDILAAKLGELRLTPQEQESGDDNLEERQLFEVKHEIKKLITELDNSGLGDTDDEKKA
jgi:hypothetical protein